MIRFGGATSTGDVGRRGGGGGGGTTTTTTTSDSTLLSLRKSGLDAAISSSSTGKTRYLPLRVLRVDDGSSKKRAAEDFSASEDVGTRYDRDAYTKTFRTRV